MIKSRLCLTATLVSILTSCSSSTDENKAKSTQPSFDSKQKNIVVSNKNCDPNSDTCTYFFASYPEFKSHDGLNLFVTNKNQLFAEALGRSSSLAEGAKEFILEYDSFRLAFSESKQPWFIHSELIVDTIVNGLVQFKESYDDYTGGAHGNYFTKYYLISPVTERSLVLSDIADSASIIELTARLTQAFREQNQLASDISLTDYGMFESSIAPNDNFMIENDSIRFVFNPYEIAPYSMGIINISISLKEASHLLLSDFKAYLVVKPSRSEEA